MEHSNVPKIGICLIELVFIFNLTKALTINTTEYTDCSFNLVAPEFGRNTKDLIERILVMNFPQSGYTVSELDPSSNTEVFLSSQSHLAEKCSINIIVAISGVFTRGHLEIYGSRLYNSSNTLFLLLGVNRGLSPHNQNTLIKSPRSNTVTADIYLVHMSSDNQTVHRVISHCQSCSPVYSWIKFTLKPNLSILDLDYLKSISSHFRQKSVLPIIASIGVDTKKSGGNIYYEPPRVKACSFLYRHRFQTKSFRIGCQPTHILVENIAAEMNLTVEYIDPIQAVYYRFFIHISRIHYTAVAVFDRLSWLDWLSGVSPVNFCSQFLRSESRQTFVYCREIEERAAFNFLFWCIPFDEWSWIFIGIFFVTWIILLKGNWFDVFSILMRQASSTLNKNKSLMIFVLCWIVLSCCYESLISSFLTVLPPVLTYDTLKDLIEHDYKIVVLPGNMENTTGLERAFKLENITSPRTFENSVINVSLVRDNQNDLLHSCQATIRAPSSLITQYQSMMRTDYTPPVWCHSTKGTVYLTDQVYSFVGHEHVKVFQITTWLRESGLLVFYQEYRLFVVSRQYNRKSSKLAEYNGIAFVMRDWKILSIFIAWAALLFVAILVLGLEIMKNVNWNLILYDICRQMNYTYNILNFGSLKCLLSK